MVWNLFPTYFESLNLAHNKTKFYKTLDYWSREMLDFYVVIVSPPHFEYGFLRKWFFMLYSIN